MNVAEAHSMIGQSAMDRRGLMARIALLVGATAIPANLFAAAPESSGAFLPPARLQLLSAVADTIIPVTDTPGAVAAGVPAAFDALLRNWASEESRTMLVGALAAIEDRSLASKGESFASLSPDARHAVLVAHDLAAFAEPSAPEPGYAKLKELVVLLYYMSEIGMTQELVYEHVPGKWEPSLKVTPQTRPFASPHLY